MSARLRVWFRGAPVASLEASDGDLVRRFTDTRDDDAFAELVRRHGPMVLSVCRRVLHPDIHTADDAFQAAFLVLATRADAVSPPERVGAFLHGVAVRVAQKARSWARKLALSGPADLDRVPAAPVEADPDAAEVRAKIDEVLASLPTKYRSPVVLCDLEGRSRAEAAALLGWSEGALSGRLFRARKLLAERLSRRGVSVPATLLATGLGVLLPASAALATVPVQLAASTVRTAVLVSTGAAAGAGEAIPASVAALAQGVPMHTTTFKLLAAGVAGVALALGGFGLYALTAADAPPPTVPGVSPTAPPAPIVARAEPGWTAKHTITHKAAVTALAFGPDLVAVGDKEGVLILWDAKTGKEKETLLDGTQDSAKPIDRLQVSPDGKWLYIVTDKWDNFHQCSVEKKDRLFPGSGGAAQTATFGVTPDGKYWLRAQGKRTLRLVDNSFPQNVVPSINTATFPHDKDIDFADACDSHFVGTISDGTLRRWEAGRQGSQWEVKLEKFEPTAMAACPVSKVFAVGGKDGAVRVYAGITGKVMVTLKGHEGAVTAIGFSPDGKLIVTGGADKTARVWDAEKGKELAVLKGHTAAVTAVAFSPEGDSLATGSADKSVKVWEAKVGGPNPDAKKNKEEADKAAKLLRGKWRVTKMTAYKGELGTEPLNDLPTVEFDPTPGGRGMLTLDGAMFARNALMLRNRVPGKSQVVAAFDLGVVGPDEKGADPRKAIDLTVLMLDVEGSSQPEQRAVRGLYEFDGDKLRLCLPLVLSASAKRPTGFAPQTADEARSAREDKLVMTLEREKP